MKDNFEVTVYLYNFESSRVSELMGAAMKFALWQEARVSLVREVALHKIGITHLSPLTVRYSFFFFSSDIWMW